MIKKIKENLTEYGLKNTFYLIYSRIFNYNRLRVIQEAIDFTNAKTYLEIGVREGGIFKKIKGKYLKHKIAVDPYKHENMETLASNEMFFQKSSDSFFEQDAKRVFRDTLIDVAFIDGLHTFDQVIKDIFNVEKFMSKNGIIIIHDCNPFTEKNENTKNQGKIRRWNGDVWKSAYYLVSLRKDLNFKTLNCDNGLGIVWGFKNNMNVYLEKDNIEKIKKLDFNFLIKNKKEIINLVPPSQWNKIKKQILSKKKE